MKTSKVYYSVRLRNVEPSCSTYKTLFTSFSLTQAVEFYNSMLVMMSNDFSASEYYCSGPFSCCLEILRVVSADGVIKRTLLLERSDTFTY